MLSGIPLFKQSPDLAQYGLLSREEIDRFCCRYRFDISGFESEQLDACDKLALKFCVTQLAGYNFAERHHTVRIDRKL